MLPLFQTPLRACSDPQEHPQGAHKGKAGTGCCWALQGCLGHTAPGLQRFSFAHKSSFSTAWPCMGPACSASCSRARRNQSEGLAPAPKSPFPGPAGTRHALGALGLAVPGERAGVPVPGTWSERGSSRCADGRAPTRSGPGTCVRLVRPPRFLPCVLAQPTSMHAA